MLVCPMLSFSKPFRYILTFEGCIGDAFCYICVRDVDLLPAELVAAGYAHAILHKITFVLKPTPVY